MTTTMIIGRKKTMRKKKKRAAKLKAKKMKTTLLRAMPRRMKRSTTPISTGRLRDLLNRINITTLPEFRIKRIPRPG
jgi:hypothetical protein